MRQEYIKDEVKKGNSGAKKKAPRIDMLPPPTKEEVLSMIGKKDRDRSRSKSKSPGPEARYNASDRKPTKSRLDLYQQADETTPSNYSRLLNNPPGGYEQHSMFERNQPSQLSVKDDT
jgi:hypothetical protein